MAQVEIYTTSYCPYCDHAKALLKRKNIAFAEISVEHDPSLRQKMMERANGRRTVPQIFINGLGVGGYDDLYALDKQGKLDTLLSSEK